MAGFEMKPCHACMLVCRCWRQSLSSAVCGVWEPVWYRGLAVRIAIGDHKPSFGPASPLQVLFAVIDQAVVSRAQLQSEARVYCLCSSSSCQLLADCTVSCRFNDFLCHTSGMGTVDNEKVLVGTLPSKSLYEYCFHPDQQCWKVSILAACLLLLKLKGYSHALASA